ncbi:MAG: hypothetical protein V2I40_09770 [Desulfobacteraceae bacterium]|jgi:hypothetical protein|nr:hypothetical protein [Desulfobacteraceae bacterium]
MPEIKLEMLANNLIRPLKQDGRVTAAHVADKLEVTACRSLANPAASGEGCDRGSSTEAETSVYKP